MYAEKDERHVLPSLLKRLHQELRMKTLYLETLGSPCASEAYALQTAYDAEYGGFLLPSHNKWPSHDEDYKDLDHAISVRIDMLKQAMRCIESLQELLGGMGYSTTQKRHQ